MKKFLSRVLKHFLIALGAYIFFTLMVAQIGFKQGVGISLALIYANLLMRIK